MCRLEGCLLKIADLVRSFDGHCREQNGAGSCSLAKKPVTLRAAQLCFRQLQVIETNVLGVQLRLEKNGEFRLIMGFSHKVIC